MTTQTAQTAQTEALTQKIDNMDTKEKKLIRQIISNYAIVMGLSTKEAFNLLTLPGLYWRFEKLMMELSKKNGLVVNKVVGCENSTDVAYVREVGANKLKDVKCEVRSDIDFHVKHNGLNFNLVWTDYCGHPAFVTKRTCTAKEWEHKENVLLWLWSHEEDPVKKEDYRRSYRRYEQNRYSYPHIDAFVNYCVNMYIEQKKGLYFMTFQADGSHLFGGREQMIQSMGGTAPSMNTVMKAVLAKIAQNFHPMIVNLQSKKLCG
jgi:hypothetical protein